MSTAVRARSLPFRTMVLLLVTVWGTQLLVRLEEQGQEPPQWARLKPEGSGRVPVRWDPLRQGAGEWVLQGAKRLASRSLSLKIRLGAAVQIQAQEETSIKGCKPPAPPP